MSKVCRFHRDAGANAGWNYFGFRRDAVTCMDTR